MPTYEGIANYLRFISETYHLEICINDFVGFLSTDKNLFAVMQPFYIHKNPYCMQIKANRELWDRCLNMKRRIYEKAQRLKSPYYGMGYCGIEEYVMPIIKNDFVIGVIFAGEYCTHKKASEYRIKKISQNYGMDYDMLMRKFDSSVRVQAHNEQVVFSLLGIVADYFSALYSDLNENAGNSMVSAKKQASSDSYVLSHAVEFIKQNFTERITVKDIADFCHCSESFFSHIFKKTMKVNVKRYINKLRIEEAKLHILNSDASIVEISNRVGFSDPNYFSLVFSEFCGISPTEYRKRITVRN